MKAKTERADRFAVLRADVAGIAANLIKSIVGDRTEDWTCIAEKDFLIHRYEFKDKTPEKVLATVRIPKTQHRQDASIRAWPSVPHAAVKEIRYTSIGHRALLKSTDDPFDEDSCKGGLKALCDLGDYQAKLLGEVMVARTVTKDTIDTELKPVLRKLKDGEPPFVVSMWATSGDRKIIAQYYDEGQSAVDYYNTDPQQSVFFNKPTDALLAKLSEAGANYVLYPARMDS